MDTKITTAAQVAALREGDIIRRYPTNGLPQATFDNTRTNNIDTFSIKAITPATNMFSLVTSRGKQLEAALPADVGRLFIKSDNFVAEQTWWIRTEEKA